MAYAILRTEKLKTNGNIGGLNSHLTRTMEVPNADPELAHYNTIVIGTSNLVADVNNRIEELGIKPRKDAVLAIEHLMTASSEAFPLRKVNENGKCVLKGDAKKWAEFHNSCRNWLYERYGKDNVVNLTVHLDESTPHIHAVVVPIDAKGKLNCKSYLGGREKMRDMQSSFAEKVKHLGLERGIEGSKAKHQDVKRFYEVIKQEPQFISFEKVEVKAPEKGMFGFGYKEDPIEVAKQQTEQINNALGMAANKINQRLLDVAGFNGKVKAEENKIKGLEATLKRFKAQNEQLLERNKQLEKKITEERQVYWNTIQKVAKGEFTPLKAQEILEEQQKQEKKMKAYQALNQGYKRNGGMSR